MNEGMENLKQIEELEDKNMEVEQLKRIADAIEEILRLVKKDMEPKKK
jgi:predicted KAP-like P-loop ATPase